MIRLRTLARAFETVLTLVTAANALMIAYLGLLTAAGAFPARRRGERGGNRHRFAILVPAHDEESVIGDALAAFSRLGYDPAKFEVHVVADNCTDRTADVVRSSAWTVHERDAPDEPGKGPALNWLFDRVDSGPFDFDVVVVIDADTVVEPGFLAAMDRAFTGGARVAQGFYSVRDPHQSAATALRFVALVCRHNLRSLGRNRLGASCGLHGNGMAFRRDVLRCRRWTGHLVEDAELQMELLLRDAVSVDYVPDARLEAEMPESFGAATSQNARWERGRVDLARRYVPELVAGLGEGSMRRRVTYVDAIADHLLPPLSALTALQVVTAGGNVVASLAGSRSGRRRVAIDALGIVVVGTHVVVGLRSVGAPAAVYRSLLSVPRFVVWKLGILAVAVRPSDDVTWQRTRRNAER